MKIRGFLNALFLVVSVVCRGQSGPEIFAPDMKKFARLDSINPPVPGAILFVGSSTFAKWTDVQSYFPKHRIINRAFGGSQFSDLIYWADKVIYPYKPKQIFIYEGDNDLGAGKSPEEVLAQARTIREMIEKNLPGVPVVFISPKPSILRWALKEKYETVNKGLDKLASHTKNTKFINMWPYMLDKFGHPLPIYEKDNLHMTAEGYKLWQPVIEKKLKK